jgi:hypothetical protein
MMLSDVPNFAVTFGYTNASWTLKSDLVGAYVCRLLNHMRSHGYVQATPRRHAADTGPLDPFVDLNAGYVQRAIDQFPKQGDRTPWRLHQNYVRDVRMLRHGAIEDGALELRRAPARAAAPAAPLASA